MNKFPRKLRVSVGSQEPADDHEMDRREAPSDRRHETIGAGHIIEPLLSIDDLAALLSCSRRVVERMRSGGKVPKPDIKIGKMPRWKAATIRAWIERGGAMTSTNLSRHGP